jgi:hypothetical protein
MDKVIEQVLQLYQSAVLSYPIILYAACDRRQEEDEVPQRVEKFMRIEHSIFPQTLGEIPDSKMGVYLDAS